MRVVKCDCKNCENVSIKMNRITVNTVGGDTKVYDICEDCFNKIMNVINNNNIVYNTGIGQAVLNDTKKDVKQKDVKQKDVKQKDVKQKDIKQKEANEKIITKASSNNKEPKRINVKKLIESYGIDKLKEEYLVKKRSARDIALELGISNITLAQYLSKLGISKRNSKNREHDEKEDN